VSLLKDLKFQVALVSLVTAGVLFFMPEIDEAALLKIVGAVVALIFGGHSVAQARKGAKKE
jgi:hypothetical protein